MDRTAALNELPEVHAVVLRLRDAGHDNATIATALGIEIESVEPLLRVAQAKLAGLVEAAPGAPTPPRRVETDPPEGDA